MCPSWVYDVKLTILVVGDPKDGSRFSVFDCSLLPPAVTATEKNIIA